MSGEGRPTAEAIDAQGLRLGIVSTLWNAELVEPMVGRALAAAKACGVVEPVHVQVPGAIELAVVAQELAAGHDAVVALGAVIRGGTPHFDYVCHSVTDGLTRVALDARTPVGNGVLTCDTVEQARARNGTAGSAEDKGWEATVAALHTAVTLLALRHREHRAGF